MFLAKSAKHAKEEKGQRKINWAKIRRSRLDLPIPGALLIWSLDALGGRS